MVTTTLRAVGGSVMFAVPKMMLESLGLRPNQQVGVSISKGRMIVEPKPKPRYALSELLAQCDASAALSKDEQGWMDDAATGREEI